MINREIIIFLFTRYFRNCFITLWNLIVLISSHSLIQNYFSPIELKISRKQRSEDIDRVSDRGFYIPGENAPHLEVLILTNTEVTDLTLRHLGRNLPSLQIIDVRATKVSADGIRRMKADFAHIQVICDWPEWCSDLSQVRSDCWIDSPLIFKSQSELPRLPPPVPVAAGNSGRNERLEVVFVEPGVVRLRRIIDPAIPVPAQALVQEDPPAPDNPGPSPDSPNPSPDSPNPSPDNPNP